MGITNSRFHHLKKVEKRESGECSDGGAQERIERSKVHWSTLNEMDDMEGDGEAKVSNVEEFLDLQRDPVWGGFFQTFGYDLGELYPSQGELVLGEKFVEGAQAELYDCKFKSWNDEENDEDKKLGVEYVLKVFKKGTYLKHLRSHLPQGLLQFHVDAMKNLDSPTPMEIPRFFSKVLRGTLLKDGRFAFLMRKEHFDLRHLIDEKMRLGSNKDCGPFRKEEVEGIMFEVALGVEWLHRHDIVHRDLKASNVLVKEFKSGWPKRMCLVADYECSVGVVGTGFFRAPEILQACKDRKVGETSKVFSKAADIYAYGMTCYEVLAGKLPFDKCVPYDFDHVLSGNRPLVPKHVEGWIHELIYQCWQSDPATRPCIEDILSLILTHSKQARRRNEAIKRDFGKEYREAYRARDSSS